ncbi:hypothetical protein CFIO01_06320 [Colletotrichum fioriniae PJ7]|uniref:Uncharacterized protein n=1 Tax=Colletotrichum fioriniae PJ7 TaxID=1445577 RepID=A0A010RCU4_9PEZI|nr:hypothetical protein CFIO01_06320 [Colletotrichum fioriniae PJ7]
MSYTSITIIVSPYHVGIPNHRVDTDPHRILSHGLPDKVESLTPIQFVNIGPVDDFEGESGHTFELLRRTSAAVSYAVGAPSFPLVLSGNCYASTVPSWQPA